MDPIVGTIFMFLIGSVVGSVCASQIISHRGEKKDTVGDVFLHIRWMFFVGVVFAVLFMWFNGQFS